MPRLEASGNKGKSAFQLMTLNGRGHHGLMKPTPRRNHLFTGPSQRPCTHQQILNSIPYDCSRETIWMFFFFTIFVVHFSVSAADLMVCRLQTWKEVAELWDRKDSEYRVCLECLVNHPRNSGFVLELCRLVSCWSFFLIICTGSCTRGGAQGA